MVDATGWKLSGGIARATPPATPVVAPAAVPAPATPGTAATASATMARQMAANAPVDLDRVTRIRQAIADGKFPILPSTIADRLLALKLEWNPNDKA